MTSTGYISEDEYVVPPIEQVASAMQSDPDLWSARIIVLFNASDGVEVAMHHVPWDDVNEMVFLLRLDIIPVSAASLTDEDGRRHLAISFGEDHLRGGIELVWFTDYHSADLVFGPNLAVLLGE